MAGLDYRVLLGDITISKGLSSSWGAEEVGLLSQVNLRPRWGIWWKMSSKQMEACE